MDAAQEMAALTGALSAHGAPRVRAHRVAGAVRRSARAVGLDPWLIVAVIRYENADLVPGAQSAAGAVGVMQVMPQWGPVFRRVCGSDLTRVETNICVGTRVLKMHLQDAGGSPYEGLLAFNGCRSAGCRSYPALVLTRWAALRSTLAPFARE